jgi:hypothetical protein
MPCDGIPCEAAATFGAWSVAQRGQSRR